MFLPLLNNRIELQFTEEQCKPEIKISLDNIYTIPIWKGYTAKELCKIIFEAILYASKNFAVEANYSIFSTIVEELSTLIDKSITSEVFISALMDKEKFEEIMNKGCKEILK